MCGHSGGYYIIHAHAESSPRKISPLVLFLLTVDLATGAMNRLQAYMVTFAL